MMNNEDLLYLIFCFLVVPVNKKYLENFEVKEIKEEIIEQFCTCLKENEKYINDCVDQKQKQEYVYLNNFKLILLFSEKLFDTSNNNIYYSHINKFLDNIFAKINNNDNKYSFIEILGLNLEQSKKLLDTDKNLTMKARLISIIDNIYLSLIIQSIKCYMEINKKYIEELSSTSSNLSIDISQKDQEISNLKKDIEKMQEDVKKYTPIVQLSTFGIFLTLIISSVGIFKVADISLYILFQDRRAFFSALILLVVTTLCILCFVVIMQRILFYAVDKKPLSLIDLFFPTKTKK